MAVNKNKPELLAAAGSLEVLKAAVSAGADAVFIGGDVYGLRAEEKDFSKEEIWQGISYARRHEVKVYMTAGIVAHNQDLSEGEKYLKEFQAQKPDGWIVADPGMFTLVRELYPGTDIHISDKANNTNYLACTFWHKQGAKRAVCGSGLSLDEIREIKRKIPGDMELGCFVHGRMCISFSGRRLLGSYFGGNEKGDHKGYHSGRWEYAITEEKRQTEYLPVYENERGTFIFNWKDLCMLEHIPELVEAGIDSLIIGGRMNAGYCADVVEAYRRAVDGCLSSESCHNI